MHSCLARAAPLAPRCADSLALSAARQVEQLYHVTSMEDQAPALWAAVQQHIQANPSGFKARCLLAEQGKLW